MTLNKICSLLKPCDSPVTARCEKKPGHSPVTTHKVAQVASLFLPSGNLVTTLFYADGEVSDPCESPVARSSPFTAKRYTAL